MSPAISVSSSADIGRARLDSILEDRKEEHQEAQAQLARLDARLAVINRDITTSRQLLEELEEEHTGLLVDIDERRTAVEDARHSLKTRDDFLESRQERLIAELDASGEEIEELEHLDKKYSARINSLSQQIQWQNSELQRLRKIVQSKTSEIDEAQKLLHQRDAELNRLIRMREQRESDIERMREEVARLNQELQRLLDAQAHKGRHTRPKSQPPVIPAQDAEEDDKPSSRKDVTPPERPGLPPGETSDEDEEDYLEWWSGLEPNDP